MIIKEFGYTPLNIDFNANSHRYKLGDMYLIGTTTVLGIRNKVFMAPWASKEAVKHLGYYDKAEYIDRKWVALPENIVKEGQMRLEDEFEAMKKLDADGFYKLLADAKKAWTVRKDKALDAGKIAHEEIQKSIEGDVRSDYIGLTDNTGWSSQTRKEVWNAYSAWLEWEKTREIEYLATELIVGSSTHYTGGTIDAIAIVDGQLELLDWKTSKRFSDDVFLQLGAYKMMLVEGGVDINIKRRSVRFDKAGAGFEEILVKSDYTKDVDTFLALLRVYRWTRDAKKNFQGRDGKLRTDNKIKVNK